MSGASVLIVEDDEAIAAGLALNLQIDGYDPTVVGDAETAIARLDAAPYALVLLDISLPARSGLDVLSDMRGKNNLTPVIVLSARRDEFDKVAALRLGADDYVTKPFALAELLARVAAVLRRASQAAAAVAHGEAGAHAGSAGSKELFRFADVVVDLRTRVVTRGGEPVKLTHLELELLAHFLRSPGAVFTREQLLRDVWALGSGSRRTVDNFVAQLRAKLERDPEQPRHLVTVRGTGYRFDP